MDKKWYELSLRLAVLALIGMLAACSAAPADNGADTAGAQGERLQVIASTGIVGDVVSQVGGDLIELTTLMQPGQDPHSYEPTARQIAEVEGADAIFVNGLGLEEELLNTLESAGGDTPIVAVSEGVELVASADGEDAHAEDEDDEHEAVDPHTWMNPLNVVTWTEKITSTLAELDPANAGTYRSNAEAYIAQLEELDAHIMQQVQTIPDENRKLVTNHEALAYFADHYGFEIIGTVFVGSSQLSEPNAGDLARLVDTIRRADVPAIFVETSVSSSLANVIAEEVGGEVEVYTLYTGSLGAPGSGADSYTGMMRANIETIVSALGS